MRNNATIEALEALNRIFDYCEEIDLNIPEEERTGYKMLDDVRIIRNALKEERTCEGCKYDGTDILDYSPCDTCSRAYQDNYEVVSE